MTFALELRDISRRFGDVVALDGATLEVRPGTVHALLGENGAGKSTLMRVAFGLVAPDQGTVRVDGAARAWRHAADALAGGIGMVHQHFTLVPAMTVAENVSLGDGGRWQRAAAVARVRALGEETGLVVEPEALLRDLPVGAQQRVEILKAVARDVRVLILDEPTAVLAPPEVEALLAWMRRFVADGRRAIVMITHKLREALSVADQVTVLRAGRTVWDAPASASPEAELVRAMLGGEVGALASRRHAARQPGAVVLALAEASVRAPSGQVMLHPTTGEVRAGEVLGIAAVEGAGQAILLRLLAGRQAPTSGDVRRPGDVSFIPEDRHRDAAVLEFTLTENLALRGLATARTMDWDAVARRADAVRRSFDVRSGSRSDVMGTLSGGNQQKLVLGRELDPTPDAIIAENPTRGLDVRATAAVLDQLRAAADAGVAVVCYSTDLDEVLSVADRVWVVHAGRVREIAGDREAIGRAMIGASATAVA
ncbi:MAG: ATP-binding cassette domain-containing protein [Gemmatimonadetes bacterium]|nr:ATP-binding cassette domain-containing protein [Gemmatimonadota bacterium]